MFIVKSDERLIDRSIDRFIIELSIERFIEEIDGELTIASMLTMSPKPDAIATVLPSRELRIIDLLIRPPEISDSSEALEIGVIMSIPQIRSLVKNKAIVTAHGLTGNCIISTCRKIPGRV